MGSQNFDEPVFVVLPGHYESVSSASQSDPNAARTIIRIIGCDNNGYWLDSDGKRYTESDLQYNWVALDTVPTLNTSKKQTAALFRGFKPTPDPTQLKETNGATSGATPGQAYYKEIPEFDPSSDDIAGIDSTTYGGAPYDIATNGISTSSPTPVVAPRGTLGTASGRPSSSLQRPNASIRNENQIEQESSKFNEIDFLLNKAHIDVLNQQSQENYGISKYKPTVIQLNLEFEIPYDLSKIQQIIELFNLKPIDVVNYLYQSVEYPEASIKQKLRNLLIPDVQPTFEPDEPVSKQKIQTLHRATTSGGPSNDIAGISKSTHGATPNDIAGIDSTTPERGMDSLQRPNANKSTEKKKPNFFDF